MLFNSKDYQNYVCETNNFDKIKDVESLLLLGARKENPDISIMIPTFKRNGFLPYTIESVLNQKTHFNYEIVVVDNNDDQNNFSTVEMLKKYPDITYYKNSKNIGMFGNWNRCLQLAHAPWVLILHDDDTLNENYIDVMLNEALKSNVACIGCEHNVIDENGVISEENKGGLKENIKGFLEKHYHRDFYDIQLKDFFYMHPTNIMGLLVNREKAISVGGFDDSWDPISDYIFVLNLAHQYSIKQCAQKVFNYRIAVNASLTVRHIIGMLELDTYMRRLLGKYLGYKNQDKFLSTLTYVHEKTSTSWMIHSSQDDRKEIKKEFHEFNSVEGIIKPSKIDVFNFYQQQRLYLANIKYWRK